MSDELSAGWTTARISELTDTQSGGTPSTAKKEYWDGGDVPWINSGALKDEIISAPSTFITRLGLENSSARLFPRNTVVIALTGATTGRVGLLHLETSTNQSVTGIFPSLAFVPEYIFYYLRSARDQVLEKAIGSAQPHINKRIVDDFTVPLAPLGEQRRIVAKLKTLLGKLDSCEERLGKIPRLLKRFRQSVLAAACSGRLTADWREQNPEVEDAARLIAKVRAPRQARFQDTSVRDDLDLAELPDTWAWTNLRFLLSPSEAFCYGVVQPGENDPAGAFLIRAGDLAAGRVDTSALRRIPLSVHHDYRRAQLTGGEILVTVVGAGIGETAIAQPECAGFNIARAVAKLPVREFSARYVHLWLSTSRALHWMKGDSREVARPTLNLEQLQTLPVPIPPLAEQDEIVRRVDQLFACQIEARFAKAQAHVDKLTQSILAKAFSGELVPQDPNDEPAAALLTRIPFNMNDAEKPTRRKARAFA